MRFIQVTLLLLIPTFFFSQENSNKAPGQFELGMRNTISTFGSTGNPGYGFGGQFRIRLSNRINTEWFGDYFIEDIEGLARRNDYHIGWSVMFYPINPENKKVLPYILAGHCFDYTKISPNYNPLVTEEAQEASRLSSATQVGLGTHFFIGENFNLSLSSQYMIHLGNDIHAEVHNDNGYDEVHIEEPNDGSLSLEGHLLFTISLTYSIGNLW